AIPAMASTPMPRKKNRLLEDRSEEHTSELQSRQYLVCRLLLEKKKIDFLDKLTSRKLARTYRCGHNKARVYHLYNTTLYDAIDQRDVFFCNDTATTEIYTLSLHDALPI